MHGHIPNKDIFIELDRTPVPDGWWPDLSNTLLQLGASIAPIDRPILAPLVTYLARHSRHLRIQAGKVASVRPPSFIVDDHPASATLFRFRHGRSAGLERLTCIGLCALIEASPDGLAAPKRLLSIVRGALETPSSSISGALGAISSIPELIRIVDNDQRIRTSLPKRFLESWDHWLRDTLFRWMLADPDRLRQKLESPDLAPQPEDPKVQISTQNGQTEGSAAVTCCSTKAFEPWPGETASIHAGRAASAQLERASVGDLLTPPEFRIPKALDERLCRGTVRYAQEQLGQDDARAEPFVALALVLAGGIREIDLRDVVWGKQDGARPYAIDPSAPVLHRRLKRPANGVLPAKHLSDWLRPSTEVVAWPLPHSVHALLLQLAGDVPISGNPVLPLLAASPASPYRMHDVVSHVVPDVKVGALAPRLALASEVATTLGTEMAQLAMADTFGMSSIPAYYSSMPETELAQCIALIQSRRFGETVAVPVGRHGYVGSRLALTDVAAKRWPEILRDSMKWAARQLEYTLAGWLSQRNHLVAALCSATGHRPEDALGRIFLADVIPEYGLIILQDKQVDALRATRIAATGRLWLADLRRYLDRLIRISKERAGTPEGTLANAILRNEEPLFSVLTQEGSIAPMTAAVLRQGMPPELQSVDNFFRHRLNQQLLARRVDPELRHGQLGWIVSPAHLHADLSPRAPVDLSRILGPVIDDLLIADGWYLPSARKTRWTWEGVPMPAPMDWEVAFASHKRQHEDALKRIRLQLRERWKEYEAPVLSRLGKAIEEFSPLLRLDAEKRHLVRSQGIEGAAALSADQHALIRDRVRLGDQDPSSGLEAVMAQVLLYRLVRRARVRGVVHGPIPSRPYLSITADPSPFLPRLGIAVRHAHALRRGLEARAKTGYIRDQAQLTVWSILAFSMYRRIGWARAATTAARTALRAKGRSHVVRIAARVDDASMHMVFSGAPAALLLRRKQRAPTSPAPSLEALEDWALEHLSNGIEWGERGAAAGRIEKTLAAAAQIELSGIERWLCHAGTQTAAESPVRCIARDDDWSIHTADLTTEGPTSAAQEPPMAEEHATKIDPSTRRGDYTRLVGLLNKRTFGRRRAAKATKAKRVSDGKHGWRAALQGELVKLREDMQDAPNLIALIGYALDHLRYGSEDGHQLAHNSLRREVTQLGWPLLVLLADRSLLTLQAEELQQLYREILLSKTVEARPYAFEEIQRFHRYLVRVHTRPSIDMSDLAVLSGTRQLRIEPGLLTPAECEAVDEELRLDYEKEQGRTDANPDFLRLSLLRRIFLLILEAAGIRPGSAYGLTLGDIHFLGDAGDFAHIRTTGAYGEAKTQTSIGFVPLRGALWEQNRPWVQDWLEEQQAAHPGEWRDLPLFASKTGSRTRVHEHHLTARINALLKWVTGNKAAHCYWLRKVCISERFHALWNKVDASARDVYGVMMISGHAWIHVTIERYINDPASLLFADLRGAGETPRALLLAMSNMEPGALDMAWSRQVHDGAKKTGILLDRMGMDHAPAEAQVRTPPPELRRFKPLLPAHVNAYASSMHRHRTRAEAIMEAGITEQQAIQFDKAAAELFVQRGYAPWRLPEQSNPRFIWPVPRRMAGSEKWFALLDEVPSDDLVDLAESWLGQPHAGRLFGDDVVMRINQNHLGAVHDLLSRTCIKMQVVTEGNHHLLKDPSGAVAMNGHSAALRWVLALVWMYANYS